MREIKFRGKRTDNGEWVYGSLIYCNTAGKKDAFIAKSKSSLFKQIEGAVALDGAYEVIPETIGQFIGKTDKHGKGIYSGDWLKDKFGNIYEVDFCDEWAAFRAKKEYGIGEDGEMTQFVAGSQEFCGNDWREWEVIDNPELLGGDGQ